MKNCINIILSLILFSSIIYPQWETPQMFPKTSHNIDYHHSLSLENNNSGLKYFWLKYPDPSDNSYMRLYLSNSSDNGSNWSDGVIVAQDMYYELNRNVLNGIVLDSDRILISHLTQSARKVGTTYSDDNGITWSENVAISPQLTGGDVGHDFAIKDSIVWIVYQFDQSIWARKSFNNGESWEAAKNLFTLTSTKLNPLIFSTEDGLIIFYTIISTTENRIEFRSSNDNGATWSAPQVVISSDRALDNLTGVSKNNNEFILYYDKEVDANINGITQHDIFKISSSDNGATWSNEENFTNYIGEDDFPKATLSNGKVLLSFASARGDKNNNKKLWFADGDVTVDSLAQPVIYNYSHVKGADSLSLTITALIDDDIEIDSVVLNYTVNGVPFPSLYLMDDGLNGDGDANDKLYGVTLFNFNYHDEVNYFITAFDNQKNSTETNSNQILFNLIQTTRYQNIDVNKVKFFINNSGSIGDAPIGETGGGIFEESYFLYNSGFFLSGYSNGELWNNGNHKSSRVEDFQSGPIGTNPDYAKNKVYTVRSSDREFGESWQDWKLAVSMGAKFYDGNNDGIYDPVDLNFNGIWDPSEDRPDLLGDITSWCIFNDGVVKELRRYDEVEPQGIEIKQTVFASETEGSNYDNIVFIRYEIENKGTAADLLDSVYFGKAIDPDIGDNNDDLVGCDTIGNNGYSYQIQSDQQYGDNPPAFFVKQLQGPPVFIPGETFIDNNNDNKFSDGIDTPLDSAVYNAGKYLGNTFIPGAKNKNINAFTQFMGSHPVVGDPNEAMTVRYYLTGGLSVIGEPIDPCFWDFGNGASLPDCNQINPKFMYSGDPVSGDGWINTTPIDQKFLLSTGPFKLEVGQPVELVYAYIVGRGNTGLNSVAVTKEISEFAQTVYDNNFQDLPTGINDVENLIVNDFKLYQNYPNPFNPVTNIKFSIPASVNGEKANVKLIVYDLLGRKVKTLVNEVKSAGSYEVQFDATSLSSGVYFYQLNTGSFVRTKKLVLLK